MNSPTSSDLVRQALAATTVDDAEALQQMIATAVGARNVRPLNDTWYNHGLMSASGSFDLKLIENVTNMQDAIIERRCLEEHGHVNNVPYGTPHEAAARFFAGYDPREVARLASVVFKESDPPAKTSKRLTAVFRDLGCGMSPAAVPRTIFRFGGSHKVDAPYLQGAFGLGGRMTFRNAKAVVVVTRRAPSLLGEGEPDRITVAVVQWLQEAKGKTAYYLVDRAWREMGDAAEPWSCPAVEFPDFEPGTHLALISYGVEGLHRQREGDERSFDVVANTRLYQPVLPVRFTNETYRAERSTYLYGLAERLERSDRSFRTGEEALPFYDPDSGETYQLPVRYVLFEKPTDPGERRKFVAKDHALVFTSNGQVHHHWTPSEFRNRTKLNRLHDRILVVVETDALPVQLRTNLFTSDRSDLVRGDAAVRLEESVVAFINDWGALSDANGELIRNALQSASDTPTAAIAKRIGRAISVNGFALGGGGGAGGGGKASGMGRAGGGGGRTPTPVDLHKDPTAIWGPVTARAVIGQSRSLVFSIDAVDEFFDHRGTVTVTCDHPDILPGREIAVGKGRAGRVRVMVMIPDFVVPGTVELRVYLENWTRAAGGLGPRLEHVTKLELVDEIQGTGSGSGKPRAGQGGEGGPSEGGDVAVQWSNPEAQEGWDKITVGGIENIPAKVLAEARAEYAGLSSLGDMPIPTILLNEEYPPYKKYLESRSKALVELERPKETYAVGVGVALVLMQKAEEANRKAGNPLPDDFVAEMQRAAARSVLAVMPAFDELAKEAGLA